MGYGAGFCNRLVEKLDRICQKFIGWLRPREHVQIHFHARQVLAQTVMKLAGKLAPLLILHLQQTCR